MELTRAVDTVYREVIEKGSRSRIQEREKGGIESQNGRSRKTEGFEQERKGLTESTAREGTTCRRIQVGIGKGIMGRLEL